MSKKILFFIIGISIGFPLAAMAQVDNSTFSKLESGLIMLKNPFESQLPEIEKPKIETPDEEQSTPEKEKARPDLPEVTEAPPVVEERPLPKVIINGIIWNSDRPQAIINETIVDIGDTISEIQIIDIRKTGIDGFFDGRKVTLQP